MMSSEHITFEKAIEDTDYGLIVCGKTGRLKGIWVPDGNEDAEIPDTVAKLCVHFFGIDPNKDDGEERIIH
jgi:hypothetical protein